MKKSPLIGVSVIAVFILVLSSLSNVIGYHTIQSSKQNIINNKINQKELLFQTIVDISNNKEIQRIILKSQLSHGEFAILTIPVLTKNKLKQIYLIGWMLSKFISKSKIHSIVQQHQMSNLGIQQEISSVIEKDVTLKGEMTQISDSNCDCENENTMNWSFPVLCLLLFPIFFISLIITIVSQLPFYFIEIIGYIGTILGCFWIFYT